MHPAIEELDNSGEFIWDHVGDEHQPQHPAAEIALGPDSELLRVSLRAPMTCSSTAPGSRPIAAQVPSNNSRSAPSPQYWAPLAA